MKPIILFLSTPRCGTQWLAKNLDLIYSDVATVLHEPLDNDYYPKLNLGRYNQPLQPVDNPKLHEHLDFIEDETQHKIYVEVGWQNIAAVPAFYEKFGERLKLVHLYRNPVYVAASLVTHNWYSGKDEDRIQKVGLDPNDQTTLLNHYRKEWDDLSLFEKSLFFWTEINMRAIEIKYKYPEVPYHTLKFEALFKENKETSRINLLETLAFIGLDYEEKIIDRLDIKHDKYRYKTYDKLNWKNIFNHPQTVALAKKLGYDFNEKIDLNRYRGFSLLNNTRHKLNAYWNKLSKAYFNFVYSFTSIEFIDFIFLYFITAC